MNSIYPYNPTKAKQLLKQAGYPNGFSFPVMDSPTDVNSAITQAIAGYERAIGIDMQISMNSTTFIPSMLSGKNPAFFAQYTLSGAQYQNLVGLASGSAFWNPRKNHIPQFDKLLTKLLYASGKKADALYAQFARTFADQAWWIAPVDLAEHGRVQRVEDQAVRHDQQPQSAPLPDHRCVAGSRATAVRAPRPRGPHRHFSHSCSV